MFRGPFRVAATFSLLLALALASTWLLTRRSPLNFELNHRDTPWRLTITSGRFTLDNEPVRRQEVLDLCRRMRQETRNSIAVFEITIKQSAHNRARRAAAHKRGNRLTVADIKLELQARHEEALAHEIRYLRSIRLYHPPPPKTPALQHSLSFTPLLAAAALLPTLRFSAFLFALLRRHSRFTHNRCTNCGYDLRATPIRCPECGHVHARVESPAP